VGVRAPNHGLFAFDAALSLSGALLGASGAGLSLFGVTIMTTDTNFYRERRDTAPNGKP